MFLVIYKDSFVLHVQNLKSIFLFKQIKVYFEIIFGTELDITCV